MYDWSVRKSDRNGFIKDLKPLIDSGTVETESYRPKRRENYHFKITKLHPCLVLTTDLDCMECPFVCVARPGSSRYYREIENCLLKKHKVAEEKFRLDEKKLIAIKALLTPKEQIQLFG